MPLRSLYGLLRLTTMILGQLHERSHVGLRSAKMETVSEVLQLPVIIEGSRPLSAESQRSEEHTSELQSQSNLVCRLLLEKKKKRNSSPIYSNSPSIVTRD